MTLTLGFMVDRGLKIEIRCIPCQHAARVEPAALIPRFGRQQTLVQDMRLYRVFRCSACGSKSFSLGRAAVI